MHLEFGERLAGDLAETRAKLLGSLTTKMQLTPNDAEEVMSELQATGALEWEDRTKLESRTGVQVGPISEAPSSSSHPGRWRLDVAQLQEGEQTPDFVPIVDEGDVSPALDLIRRALKLRATDIHLDPGEGSEVMVRIPIDGRLEGVLPTRSWCRRTAPTTDEARR